MAVFIEIQLNEVFFKHCKECVLCENPQKLHFGNGIDVVCSLFELNRAKKCCFIQNREIYWQSHRQIIIRVMHS